MSLFTNSPLAGRYALFHVTADVTLVPEDTGKVYLLDAGGGTITIPAAAAANRGVHYKFIVDTKVTTDWSITSGAADLHIHIGSGGGAEADTLTSGSADTTVVFQNDVADEGDFIEMFSTGSVWMVQGQAHATANITAS